MLMLLLIFYTAWDIHKQKHLSPAEIKMNARHILVVDDDSLTTHALKDHFQNQRYYVSIAEGCQEARQVLRSPLKVDLLILDYLFPNEHGTDLLCSMANESDLQKPQVIMSSAIIDPAHPSWGELLKRLPVVAQTLIKAYVNKPYTFDSMDAMVNLILTTSEKKPQESFEVLGGDYHHTWPPASDVKIPNTR
jgi:DNA-binding response OmpR family regulator